MGHNKEGVRVKLGQGFNVSGVKGTFHRPVALRGVARREHLEISQVILVQKLPILVAQGPVIEFKVLECRAIHRLIKLV